MKYHVGGCIYYRNQYGQDMYGKILEVRDNLLLVQRACWPSPEWINPDDYVRTRYWSSQEVRQEDKAREHVTPTKAILPKLHA
jgi:hypothetical protein